MRDNFFTYLKYVILSRSTNFSITKKLRLTLGQTVSHVF